MYWGPGTWKRQVLSNTTTERGRWAFNVYLCSLMCLRTDDVIEQRNWGIATYLSVAECCTFPFPSRSHARHNSPFKKLRNGNHHCCRFRVSVCQPRLAFRLIILYNLLLCNSLIIITHESWRSPQFQFHQYRKLFLRRHKFEFFLYKTVLVGRTCVTLCYSAFSKVSVLPWGRAVAQAVSRWGPKAAARVRTHLHGGKSMACTYIFTS
jgi:hypothetical protein